MEQQTKRKKILLISDDIRIPSGVGGMALRIVQRLTSKYDFVHIAAAVQHPETNTTIWNGIKIIPTSGFGNPQYLRQILQLEQPDVIFIFTDPRFFTWIWMMEDEIRSKIPIFYYHVWDNDPIPLYNRFWYESCDYVSCISTNSYNIVKSFGVPCNLNLHGIDPAEYFVMDEETRELNRRHLLGKKYNEEIFIVAWINRNIRRKCPNNIIAAFAEFNKNVPNSIMVMHTDAVDNDGTDLWRVHRDLFPQANILFSTEKHPPAFLNALYNAADVTINVPSNEGFGLATCESLMSGTPIIVGLTGGLRDQIVGPNGEFTGIGIEPSARNLAGSIPTPYIYEDFYSHDDIVFALNAMYNMSLDKPKMQALRHTCRKVAEEKFNANGMAEKIDEGLQWCFTNFKPRTRWQLTRASW